MTVEIVAGPDGARIAVKVIPNAKRDEIVGALGTRLKIRVAAAPEGGRANAAACGLIAHKLALPKGLVTIEFGHTTPRKIILVRGLGPEAVRARLDLDE
ncbi:MAG: DUF167 domain-containing protein [Phycisphaerales bacterium]